MPSRNVDVRHSFGGGWATDFPIAVDLPPDQLGRMNIPYLLTAKNLVYDLNGSPEKMPGTSRLNSVALSGSVRGLVDFFIQGGSGTPSQHRVVHAGTKISEDDADGTFADLFTGVSSTSIPNYTIFEDILIIASDEEVPKSWNGSTAQNLAGSPPNFSFATVHKNRVWAAGVDANPSRLYYSALLDGEDWAGAGSGSIDVDPSDGDKIMAIASFRDNLWIFKGPNRGSIHRITGSSPTGDDAFARVPFKSGVGCAGPNLLFHFRDDLGFVDFNGAVRSLTVTDQFGDFVETALSFPLNREFVAKRVNISALKKGWAVANANQGIALITIPVDGSTTPNFILEMDYRFNPARWAQWDAFTATCLANVVDSSDNNKITIFSGDPDGYVNKLFQENRRVEGGTEIEFKVETPYLSYGQPRAVKTLVAAGLSLEPQNDGDVTFGWTRDNLPQKTLAFAQGGSDTLGPSSDPFTLNTSVLGGSAYREPYQDTISGGEFRIIKYILSNDELDENVKINNFTVVLDADGLVLEDLT